MRAEEMARRLLISGLLAALLQLPTPAVCSGADSRDRAPEHDGTRAEVSGSGGIRIHTEEYGPRDAPAIVLVHGLMRDLSTWAPQTGGEPAGSFRLIAMDLRGHGRSERPSDPSAYAGTALWAGDLKAVLEHYRLDRPILLGWSFGGQVVLDYLSVYGTDSIAGLVLVSTRVGGGRGTAGTGAGRGDSPSSPRWVATAILSAGREDHTAVLERVSVPVLVIHGDRDPVVPSWNADYSATHAFDARKVILPGVGHSPHLEAAEEFNRLLLDFAERVYGRGR